MPCTPAAVDAFRDAGVNFAPGKAANAGGVAVSSMEMSQNAMRQSRSREKIDAQLHETMQQIHRLFVEHGKQDTGPIDYVAGANIAGFRKIADAMLAYGVASANFSNRLALAGWSSFTTGARQYLLANAHCDCRCSRQGQKYPARPDVEPCLAALPVSQFERDRRS